MDGQQSVRISSSASMLRVSRLTDCQPAPRLFRGEQPTARGWFLINGAELLKIGSVTYILAFAVHVGEFAKFLGCNLVDVGRISGYALLLGRNNEFIGNSPRIV